ncbi:hypothetical protein P3102_23645 [Amycolatopsis sp. QT-25]|uniref:hypothetical protein n=1 Tax=Amycolatopsis sp. QT-25 TaxID=3034022 RepID=UPI0023EBB6A4|nr:hypothetical protein [Amycolatopsis sp. QT-25]WET77087.1 hypothetical protein P3102_23645 [Amycolatopsis sp. QT-25]
MPAFGHFDERTALRSGAAAAASVAFTTALASSSSARPVPPGPSGPAGTSSIVTGYRELQTGIDRPSAERTAALANLDRLAEAVPDDVVAEFREFFGNLGK